MKKSSYIKVSVLVFIAIFFTALTVKDILAHNNAASESALSLAVSSETPEVTPSPINTITISPTIIETSSHTPLPTTTPEPYTDIIIGAVGDIMMHIRQVDDADAAGRKEGYSFYHWFEYIKPALLYPDLMIANLEGPIAGEESGYNGYPMFNFPDEIVPAMKDAGIDVALNANNHTYDRKMEGLLRTIKMLDEGGIYHTGTWVSESDRMIPLIINVNGIKVGIVSATYSLNGLEKAIEPEVLEWLVCYIDKEQVKQQINLCRENGAEVVIVCPHMGDENKTDTRQGIREYAESYVEMGADIVFASHPHALQPVEMYEAQLEDGTQHEGIIFYSLGNFISGMYGITNETGAIAYVTIRRDNISKDISIHSSSYLPTSTLRHGDYGDLYHIIPIGNFLDFPEQYDKLHPDASCFYRLEHEWDLATGILGSDVSQVLRYMPQKD